MGGLRSLVGGLCAAASVVTLVSCSSGGDGSSPEPLAALIGDDGKFDCRRMYTHVPLQAYFSASLSLVDTREAVTSVRPVSGEDGVVNCPVRYAGKETDGRIVPFFIRSVPTGEVPKWASETSAYGDWTIGTMTLVGSGDAAFNEIAVAALDSPEHGVLLLFTPTRAEDRESFVFLGDEAPSAVRTVIDGLEKDAGVPVPASADNDGLVSLFTTDDRFDCSAVFRRLSLTTAETVDITLSVQSGMARIVRDSGERRSCALATGAADTDMSRIFGMSTDLTTGPKDAVRGTPFTGIPDFAGWEEYWNFDGADDPVDATFEGRQSYNARYCRNDSDCITVTAYTGSGEEGGDSPQARKDAALPLVRLVAEREGLLADGEQQ